jgi:hypothetical protein
MANAVAISSTRSTDRWIPAGDPTGFLRIGRRAGEVGVARAAGAMGTIQVMTSAGGYSVDDVTAAASGPIFYQLFLFGDRQIAETEIERAQKAGCQALVITVDTMAHGMRERPIRRRTPMPGTPLPMRELIRMLPRAASMTRPDHVSLGPCRDGATQLRERLLLLHRPRQSQPSTSRATR